MEVSTLVSVTASFELKKGKTNLIRTTTGGGLAFAREAACCNRGGGLPPDRRLGVAER
ncbi:Protein yippee-like [Psidium guajava]|nr:Protein yippee-like [Psidium guajava]